MKGAAIIAAIGCMADIITILDIIWRLKDSIAANEPNAILMLLAIFHVIEGAIIALILTANMLTGHLRDKRRDHSKRLMNDEADGSIADGQEKGPQPMPTNSTFLVEGTQQAVKPLGTIIVHGDLSFVNCEFEE